MHSDVLSVVHFAHSSIRALCPDARLAVDATVGNGSDTEFLCQLCGAEGIVIGLDIQSQALELTRQRLEARRHTTRVELLQRSHELLEHTMHELGFDSADVVMFNLGYLPGADKALTTQAHSSVSALTQALSLLKPGGVLSVCCYVGHPGGTEERDAVAEWIGKLDAKQVRVTHFRHLLQAEAPECYLVVRKVSMIREVAVRV